MGLIKDLILLFRGWEKITKVPNWVKKSKKRFCKGDNFFYKKVGKDCYRKSRGLHYQNKRLRGAYMRWQKGKEVIFTPKGFRNPFEP